jgi:hypothetical protein
MELIPDFATEWSAFLLLIREVPVRISVWRQTILNEAFRDFPQSIESNYRIVPYIEKRPLSSASFPVTDLLTILSSEAIKFKLLTTPLNNPEINHF